MILGIRWLGLLVDTMYAVLKLVLAAGANPDLSDRRSKGWRPSHVFARDAKLEEAKVLFLCRPDLEARNELGDTPLEAALRPVYRVSVFILFFRSNIVYYSLSKMIS